MLEHFVLISNNNTDSAKASDIPDAHHRPTRPWDPSPPHWRARYRRYDSPSHSSWSVSTCWEYQCPCLRSHRRRPLSHGRACGAARSCTWCWKRQCRCRYRLHDSAWRPTAPVVCRKSRPPSDDVYERDVFVTDTAVYEFRDKNNKQLDNGEPTHGVAENLCLDYCQSMSQAPKRRTNAPHVSAYAIVVMCACVWTLCLITRHQRGC